MGDTGRIPPSEVYRQLMPTHQMVRALAATRPERLGYELAFVCTSPAILDDDHPFFGPLLRAARMRAGALGIDVVWLAPTLDDWLDDLDLDRAVSRQVAGIVVFGGSSRNPDALRDRWPAIPAVFVEFDSLGARSAHVAVDNERAFAQIVHHLAANGRKRIATITGREVARPGAERLRGYRSALATRGLEVRPELVQHGDWSPDSGYDGMQRLLALRDRPDAVAAACDVQAVGALVALEEAGLRCPVDVAVTGFDDAAFAARLLPSLTTVRQPATEMGIAAVDTIAALVADPLLQPPYVLKTGELIVRESSGATQP